MKRCDKCHVETENTERVGELLGQFCPACAAPMRAGVCGMLWVDDDYGWDHKHDCTQPTGHKTAHVCVCRQRWYSPEWKAFRTYKDVENELKAKIGDAMRDMMNFYDKYGSDEDSEDEDSEDEDRE